MTRKESTSADLPGVERRPARISELEVVLPSATPPIWAGEVR